MSENKQARPITDRARTINDKAGAINNTTLQAALDIWKQTGHHQTIPIEGQSMLPLFREGDQVQVAYGAAVRPGDVVAFRQQGKLIVHRLLRTCYKHGESPLFITKGDNALHLDPPLKRSDMLGRVIRVERKGRSMRLDTWPWWVTGSTYCHKTQLEND